MAYAVTGNFDKRAEPGGLKLGDSEPDLVHNMDLFLSKGCSMEDAVRITSALAMHGKMAPPDNVKAAMEKVMEQRKLIGKKKPPKKADQFYGKEEGTTHARKNS